MNLTDGQRRELADILTRAEHVTREHARILEGIRAVLTDPPAPSFHPERDGTLGEVEPGDRVMWGGLWREVASTERRLAGWFVRFVPLATNQVAAVTTGEKVRIQKRAAADDLIPGDYKLASGAVAYTTVRAGEVVPGMWVDCDDEWKEVIATNASDDGTEMAMVFTHGPTWLGSTSRKARVASTVDAARMAAERQAQQAEAYDSDCGAARS